MRLAELAKERASLVVPFEDLDTFPGCNAVVTVATGKALSRWRFELFLGLNIQEHESRQAVDLVMPTIPPKGRLLERFISSGGDATGFTVRAYTTTDAPTVASWMAARGIPFHAASELPPAGVIIEDATGPAAALWCYEAAGIGVGFLRLPVTRPGLSPRQAWNACGMALVALVDLAGECFDPPGEYRVFHVSTYPAIARFLKRLGFVESLRDKVTMTLRI